MPEVIYKLQPDRTIYLRGFDGRGAAAALWGASANGCKVSGIWRDPADFAVLIVIDADNGFEHPRIRYLPSFDYTGIVWTFDLEVSGCEPLDSTKFPTIDWAFLDVIRADGTTAKIPLFDNAVLAGGESRVAWNRFPLQDNGFVEFDRVTLWYLNFAFDYIVPKVGATYSFFVAGVGTVHSITVAGVTYSYTEVGGESSADIATNLAAQLANDPNVTASASSNQVLMRSKKPDATSFVVSGTDGNATVTLFHVQLSTIVKDLVRQINTANWPVLNPSMAVIATVEESRNAVLVEAARFGTVSVTGKSVTLLTGMVFNGLAAGNRILINDVERTVESVESARQLTLTEDIGIYSSVKYLAPRGGRDGRMLGLYAISKNNRLTVPASNQIIQLQTDVRPDGTQWTPQPVPPAVWRVSIDFSALGVNQIRQAWLTFAPELPNSTAYLDSTWEVKFTNWTVTDPNGVRPLKVAGAGSVRVEESDYWVSLTGVWTVVDSQTGFYSKGFARRASVAGAAVTVAYVCQFIHDLYLGTSLYSDRGIVGVSLDGDAQTNLDCYLATEPPVIPRRPLRTAVSAGQHQVTVTILSDANPLSTGKTFDFDFLEAAVPSDVPDPAGPFTTASPALDHDTDHTFKHSPQRLLWAMVDKLGFRGPINFYQGVFWWNQHKRSGATIPQADIEFAGTFVDQDQIFITIGTTTIGKTVFPADTVETIAHHFRLFINATFVGVWAQQFGFDKIRVTNHSPTAAYSFTLSTQIIPRPGSTGLLRVTGSLEGGVPGTWIIDTAQNPPHNKAVVDWQANFFAEIATRGLELTMAYSMELVNPPEGENGEVWAARYADGALVETATGFGTLKSTHCTFSATVREYLRRAYVDTATRMIAAGLTPWLQFGEFLWWYFSNYDAATNPDGGMAYYDAYTKAQAQISLGRDLYVFRDPDDDPALNQADADFLRGQLRGHVDALIFDLTIQTSLTAKFEVLLALDVNYGSKTAIAKVGGRLNRFVNIPLEWRTQGGGSGLDRIKVECLAFGRTERDNDLVKQAIRFMKEGWPVAKLLYLVALHDGGCPWERERLIALGEQIPKINYWAYDHVCFFNWEIEPAGLLNQVQLL